MIMKTLWSLLICISDLPQYTKNGIELGKKKQQALGFFTCLKCQPWRIYVLLADINVSVVVHEVNNEKVRPCPQKYTRELLGEGLQHLFWQSLRPPNLGHFWVLFKTKLKTTFFVKFLAILIHLYKSTVEKHEFSKWSCFVFKMV